VPNPQRVSVEDRGEETLPLEELGPGRIVLRRLYQLRTALTVLLNDFAVALDAATTPRS
jgi:hypothetical protein